ncbi:acireductone dioxygenase [Acetobacter sp. TBRC 12305]|uniref:Acireductone dioxygenase n=1 Tax=Acetobacter garciniae TaxID=2817435 RepID=A0A939HJ86_9PROT|nr:cupin domain-containing protein [Acetobacter garciniae]MBO1323745.1 acireductone dioxygenase [Acetobacter garciniae]MBX0343434.1 acireductone dioxygenase [Acetobacter garciniae]
MSTLVVYNDGQPDSPTLRTQDVAEIAHVLAAHGVRFERWEGPAIPERDAPEDVVLQTYRPWLDRLMGETGAGSADVLRVSAQTPNYPALREKFLSEHTHSEDEVRFFVHGGGHFILHLDGQVYDVHCTQGDLISVPEGVRHWFDAGPAPDVVALRIFTHKEGWVAQYTGSDIAGQFPAYAA